MLTTTLNEIRKHSPCEDGWRKMLAHLDKTKADDEPLPFAAILEANGLDDALWCLRALPDEHAGPIRLLACDLAERALVHVPDGEERPRQAIETARAYARGEATAEELEAAGEAARAAARAAAGEAPRAAAGNTARAAAWEAARAAWAATWAAAGNAAWTAAWTAAGGTVWTDEREAQAKIFQRWLGERGSG